MRTGSLWLCTALAILVGGCGIASPPPGPLAPSATAARSSNAAQEPPPPPSSSPPKIAAAPKAIPGARPRSAPTAAAKAPPASARALDLKSLEQRLKETSAIGVLTKLSLKNQVDDLVQRFRAFHQGQRPPGLAELRPAFDLLLMKVLSLLQDKDVVLAKDIDASRSAIWGVLTDREKLARVD
jgi:hypothetical protein